MSERERFEKFTERAQKVLMLSQQEAGELRHNYIGTEHLLLGLIREGNGIAARVLGALGVRLGEARTAVIALIGRGDRMQIGDISLTPRAKRVIELAVEEARGLNHNHVGTEHLLLGLVREGEGIGFQVLLDRGLTAEGIRQRVIDVASNASAAQAERGTGVPRDNVVTCRVDDQTLNALDALVETGVHATRSEAAARLIRAGITSERAFFEKVFAAVGEIRRVREETRRLVRDVQEASPEGDAGTRPGGAPPAPPAGDDPPPGEAKGSDDRSG